MNACSLDTQLLLLPAWSGAISHLCTYFGTELGLRHSSSFMPRSSHFAIPEEEEDWRCEAAVAASPAPMWVAHDPESIHEGVGISPPFPSRLDSSASVCSLAFVAAAAARFPALALRGLAVTRPTLTPSSSSCTHTQTNTQLNSSLLCHC